MTASTLPHFRIGCARHHDVHLEVMPPTTGGTVRVIMHDGEGGVTSLYLTTAGRQALRDSLDDDKEVST